MISYVFLKSASHNFVSYFIQECLGILAARCAGLSVITLFSADSTKQNILTVTRLSGSATCSGYFYFNKYFLFLAAKNPCLDFYGRIFFQTVFPSNFFSFYYKPFVKKKKHAVNHYTLSSFIPLIYSYYLLFSFCLNHL